MVALFPSKLFIRKIDAIIGEREISAHKLAHELESQLNNADHLHIYHSFSPSHEEECLKNAIDAGSTHIQSECSHFLR